MEGSEAPSGAAGGGGHASRSLHPDDLLAQALEEERRGGFGAGGQMIEISGADLMSGRAQLLAAQAAAGGSVFGAEYEAKLRAEAGAKPSDVSRRKHQIGSLLHDAKLQELKVSGGEGFVLCSVLTLWQAMEGRSTQSKSKQMTRAKYGW